MFVTAKHKSIVMTLHSYNEWFLKGTYVCTYLNDFLCPTEYYLIVLVNLYTFSINLESFQVIFTCI